MSLTNLNDLKLPFTASQLTPSRGLAGHHRDDGRAESSEQNVPVPLSADRSNDSLNLFVTRQVLSAYTAADQFQQANKPHAGTSAIQYPQTQLAANLQLIAQLIRSGAGARVFYTQQGGYDTHAAQLYTHARLLSEFSEGLKAFLDDLKSADLEERVIVLAFSEFGRRVKENASQGTDHGAAGPVFVAGSQSAGGLVGAMPSLTDLDDGDLRKTTDMREIYATILEDWLGINATSILASTFNKAVILRS
jgi:uncharacterized protein (DUF1501 family)